MAGEALRWLPRKHAGGCLPRNQRQKALLFYHAGKGPRRLPGVSDRLDLSNLPCCLHAEPRVQDQEGPEGLEMCQQCEPHLYGMGGHLLPEGGHLLLQGQAEAHPGRVD